MTNEAGLPLSPNELGLIELYQSDIPLLGQETPIYGLLPGQFGVILKMNEVQYVFYTSNKAAKEHAALLAAEAEDQFQTEPSPSNFSPVITEV